MKTKTTPNVVLADLLRLEMEYYKHCEREKLDVKERALYLGHYFSFMRKHAKRLATILNSHLKYE
jgi:hypothetical protein